MEGTFLRWILHGHGYWLITTHLTWIGVYGAINYPLTCTNAPHTSYNTYLDFHFVDYKATPVILLLQIFFLGRLQTPLENFIIPARFFFNFVLMKSTKIVNRVLFNELCYKRLHAEIFEKIVNEKQDYLMVRLLGRIINFLRGSKTWGFLQ